MHTDNTIGRFNNLDRYLFLDIETTGLDYASHDILEVAYAVGDGKIHTCYPTHKQLKVRIAYADPKALEVNKWLERYPDVNDVPQSTGQDWINFLRAAMGKTLVGANPRFDVAFLSAEVAIMNAALDLRLTDEPWHHRLLDIEVYAMGVLNINPMLSGVIGLSSLIKRLSEVEGYVLPRPDHTAAGDVLATRTAFKALLAEAEAE